MRLKRFLILTILIFCGLQFLSCNSHNHEAVQPVAAKHQATTTEQIQHNIDSLKTMATDGDLVVRMNDNLISYAVKSLNETDKSFSHSGIIITLDHEKMVCSIEPGNKGADTVRFEPIDSFINPQHNLACGLFRYNLSDAERALFLGKLIKYHESKTRFDMRYDLTTDHYIYCTEMIYKSLKKATNDRIHIRLSHMPHEAVPLMKLYFERYNFAKEVVATRKFVTIDNLYLLPECKEIIRFPLKYFPGQ